MRNRLRTSSEKKSDRTGAAAVEFALVAPVFVGLVMGAIQAGYSFDSTNKMYSSIRQSGRLAALQNSATKLQSGQTLNAKIIQDVKNSLVAEGLPGNQMTVTITDAAGTSNFDLSSKANDLKYFKIAVTVPYSTLNTNNFMPSSNTNMNASIVFRKGRSSLIQ